MVVSVKCPWTYAVDLTFYAAGAVQFLFKLPDGRKYIHCGDMRFGEHLMGNKHLQRFVGADGVFLDTTYCKAKHQFPHQVCQAALTLPTCRLQEHCIIPMKFLGCRS